MEHGFKVGDVVKIAKGLPGEGYQRPIEAIYEIPETNPSYNYYKEVWKSTTQISMGKYGPNLWHHQVVKV